MAAIGCLFELALGRQERLPSVVNLGAETITFNFHPSARIVVDLGRFESLPEIQQFLGFLSGILFCNSCAVAIPRRS